MRAAIHIFRRELASYFATPVAYVFLIIFLALAGTFTFYVGNFFQRGQADLQPFFNFHPWLYLFLIPAISMRLWSEERRSGTIELMLTLPVSTASAVIGKFLAAWVFTAIALSPDNGVIVAGYVGSLLMAGGYLAIGACMSALTRSQVIAFVVAAAVCFLFTVSGSSIVLNLVNGWLPQTLTDTIASFSFLDHFSSITRGVIGLDDLVYFGSLMGLFLFANAAIVDLKKSS